MKRLKVKQIDVFTTSPLCGNPAAVILNARGLNTEEMQAIAREMNLSETTFVLPPTRSEADYLLRIFTPRSELPFAGHPTIATAHALIEQGDLSKGRIPSLGRGLGVGEGAWGRAFESCVSFKISNQKLRSIRCRCHRPLVQRDSACL